ncbi:hypothetical protein KL86PLE_60275 [uncultured Pleomorphomonas sp.]|uniref:Uncharacterized protein n=1 Tax=uncultured Pleomorphomonas sp. TaxID=442121 RepID=A0A212LKC0_9HYPH|nr:hypothetical protein KL86PLE_60275 [uncultured Pleomorphomonas sp.]
MPDVGSTVVPLVAGERALPVLMEQKFPPRIGRCKGPQPPHRSRLAAPFDIGLTRWFLSPYRQKARHLVTCQYVVRLFVFVRDADWRPGLPKNG